ncbi:MAG: hypothetical protein ACRD0C_13005 [Acidimicrobiia bacterium]
MNPAVPPVEILRQPALAVEAPLQLSGTWFNELCLWLQCRIGSLGAIGWPMVLIPEVIDRRFRAWEDALQIYLRATWSAPVPSEPFIVGAEVAWVSSKDGSLEVGVRSRAVDSESAELATSLLVLRTRGDAGSWGERDVPALPAVGTLSRRRSLVIDEGQVRTFAQLAGTKYPVHTDVRYAWARGFPNILVQGHVLAITQLHFAGVGPSGRSETWFRRPVPAASLLEVCRSQEDESVWAFRLVSTGDVAAVTRITPGP